MTKELELSQNEILSRLLLMACEAKKEQYSKQMLKTAGTTTKRPCCEFLRILCIQWQEPPDRKLRYDRYFYINVSSKDGSLSFRRNNESIDRALRQCGYFMIAETDFKKTTAEILELCRRRDVIEKSFDNLKNELDMNRLRIHSEAAAEGKTFVAFIALVIRSQLLKKLSSLMTTEQMTLRKALTELDKAKLIISADSVYGARLLNPPTRIQKNILSALDLPLNSFELVL